MLKSIERSDSTSCWNKARENERVFVLLARDLAAPMAIRAWVGERLNLGLNLPDDEQITEALECAKLMEREQARAKKAQAAVSVGATG
jgi:hypothetical protein